MPTASSPTASAYLPKYAPGRMRSGSARATRRGAPCEAWGSTGNCESRRRPTRDRCLTRVCRRPSARATRRGAPCEAWGSTGNCESRRRPTRDRCPTRVYPRPSGPERARA
jgi:hypothetical protein